VPLSYAASADALLTLGHEYARLIMAHLWPRPLRSYKAMTAKSTVDWNDPNLVFPRPEDAPLIGPYALVTEASTAAQTVYLDGYPANKIKVGGANFYTWRDKSVHAQKEAVQPPTGGGEVPPNWTAAWDYPSDHAMVDDLSSHQFPNQVLLDGNQVQAFVSGFGPALNYWTKTGGVVSQTPNVDQGGGGGSGGGGDGGQTQDGVVLPWGGEVRTGE